MVTGTPPPGTLPITARAIRAASRVVMPAPPTTADLDRAGATSRLAAGLSKLADAVLTQVRGGLEDAAAAAVTLQKRAAVLCTPASYPSP